MNDNLVQTYYSNIIDSNRADYFSFSTWISVVDKKNLWLLFHTFRQWRRAIARQGCMRPAAWLQRCGCSRSGGILALLIAAAVSFGLVDIFVVIFS